MNISSPRPLVPSDRLRTSIRPGAHLERAVVANVIARAYPGGKAEQIARERYGDDASTLCLIERAAVSGATTTATGWAAELAAKSVGDFALSLPASAASQLFSAGLTVDMNGQNELAIPRLAGPLPVATFIDEVQPAPAVALLFGSTTLGPPGKLMLLAGYSRELARSSAAEAVIGAVFREAAAASLDAALFSTTAASSARPAGLLAGVTPLTPAAGGTYEAAATDMSALLGAVAAGGGGDIALVAGTRAAVAIKLRFPDLAFPIWVSTAIAADQLIALDTGSFIAAFGPVPEITASVETTVHFEDTAPLQIGTAGAPPTVAAPTRSAFQTASIVVRVVLDCAWMMRESSRVAVVNAVTWA